MRGIPSLITDIRKKVFTEVARMAYSGQGYAAAEELPYIIVNNDGGSEGDMTKDSWSESPEDKVNISILMVCRNREELADMTLTVRKTISDFMKATWQRIEEGNTEEGDEIAPTGYQFSFSDISYIIEKPAHRQMFYYDCTTPNEIYIEDDEQD
jgi:hypothetical protein